MHLPPSLPPLLPLILLLLLSHLHPTHSTPTPNPANADTNGTLLSITSREIHAGEDSGLSFEAWSEADCKGGAILNKNVKYNEQNHITNAFRSYRIDRDLAMEEQLDFSIPEKEDTRRLKEKMKRSMMMSVNPRVGLAGRGLDVKRGDDTPSQQTVEEGQGKTRYCSVFYQSAVAGTKANCWTLDNFVTCYRLWHH